MGNAISAGARSQRQRLGLFVAGKHVLFDEYDNETLESARQSLIKRDYLVAGALGWNDFDAKHKSVKKRQRRGACRPEKTTIERISKTQTFGTS